MNSFEFNKIMMALLLTVLVVFGISGLTEVIYADKELESNAFPIKIAVATVAAQADDVVEEGPTLAELLATASIDKGQAIFKKCKACHSSDNGGKNLVGPNLWNIVGRAKGTHEGYAYSDGMKNAGGNWTFEDINTFLTKPGKFVPKTKMSFAGLKKPTDRAAVILYLHTFSDSPIALPAVVAPAVDAPGAPAPVSDTPAESPAE